MRYYELLLEVTSDDLFRKIAALDQVIARTDSATTQGEKDAAVTLKAKLQNKLKSEFPNAKPPSPKTLDQPIDMSWWENTWWGQIAKATSAQAEREKYWKENPGAEQAYWRQELNRLRSARRHFYNTMIGGYVPNNEIMNDYNYQIDSILRKHFPDEWEIELKKREKKRDAGYKYREKKAKEREDALKKDMSKQKEKLGLGTFKEVNKEYADVLERFYDKIRLLRMAKGYGSKFKDIFSKKKVLDGLDWLGTGDIRNKWSELPPEDQALVKQAVEKVNTLGYNANGYTEAQKKRILDAMRPSKAAPSKYRDPDAYQKFLARREQERRKRRGW